MVNTLESVNYTKLNTSRGKLYDNKGDVRRSFLLHQSMFIVSNIIVISLYSSFLQVYWIFDQQFARDTFSEMSKSPPVFAECNCQNLVHICMCKNSKQTCMIQDMTSVHLRLIADDTECDAVDICGSFQKCILSNNNTTAVLCNPMQHACYLECGPNGECVQSVDTTYCR